jgi:hypothetical protein
MRTLITFLINLWIFIETLEWYRFYKTKNKLQFQCELKIID